MRKYRKAVTFSYDDGISQDRRLVEIFNRYHLKATFNLNTGIQTEESRFEIEGKLIYRMNQSEIGTLYQGHEIAVHGLAHLAPSGLTALELDREFGEDMENIACLYGEKPVGMAYAYGAYDDVALQWLQQHGIRYGRTVESSHAFEVPENPILLKATCHHNDGQLFELAEEFIGEDVPEGGQRLFYIWGHSYEFDVHDNWERMERLCGLISGREDIFYGTNKECLELFGCI